jgi:hypothetical protein
MRVYTYSEARREFSEFAKPRAPREGEVQVRRRGGQVFVVRPSVPPDSPLDVAGVRSRLSRDEIVKLVGGSRRLTGRLLKNFNAPKK